ncbi:MAG: hypothetical protein JJE22_08965 [Bacteroidia bacterium]|nr:hypothetical protein [Bacteroidia bacterium]
MQHKKRILLVQLFSNGDCLYATAVARQIKQDFPGCHLTWAIADFCKEIILHNPYVDQVWTTNEVPKNDVIAFRRFKKKAYQQKREGKWDEVFNTHNMDSNQALYDGTIRGMIFRAYPSPVTVPIQPALILSKDEKQNVKQFSEHHRLADFKNIILWEYAPQSGQSVLDINWVMRLSERIVQLNSSTCIILSSATSFSGTDKIIDASKLSVRENAELTHYCSLLIGCSSGITWLSTSSAAQQLPMLQLLNPDAFFLNAPSVDFKRYGLSTENLIEILYIEESRVYECVRMILEESFLQAKNKFNQELPLQFNTTRKIVYNLLCYLQFKSIAKHYRIMTSIYGKHPLFLKQFVLGFITFPFKLIANTWRKRVAS